MSADNGIYVAQFTDGKYRVAHAQAIENLEHSRIHDSTEEYLETIKSYFGNSKEYSTKEQALIAAHEMEEAILNSEIPILEYGVNCIGGLPYWEKKEN